MKKIVIFTGAGISAESGIETFRGGANSTWNNVKVEEVATIDAWHKNRTNLLEFYNKRNSELVGVKPNLAHNMIAELEKDFDVSIITQNVDGLHEMAGSTNVLHLHGELSKMREEGSSSNLLDYKEIKEGDLGPNGKQLRPHIVWFGEMPFNVNESYEALQMADYVLIVGTSLLITYTIDMLCSTNSKAEVFYIDPKPSLEFESKGIGNSLEYVFKPATIGVKEVIDKIYAKIFG